MPGVLPYVETGIKFRFALEQVEVQYADADTFFEYGIVLAGADLFREHFSQIEQGTVSPDIQRGELDFNVNLRSIVHQDPHIKDPKLFVFMELPEAGVQDSGFPNVSRIQF